MSARPPLRAYGVASVLIIASVMVLLYRQSEGAFVDETPLTVMSDRSGLAMDVGAKVTLNGVQVGRVTRVNVVDHTPRQRADITLAVDTQYLRLIPDNVIVAIKASTVFGAKYVSLESPAHPTARRISPDRVMTASAVTTESNTLFETVVAVAEQVDPIKLNQTLSAAAQALDGLGGRFGGSVTDGSDILAEVNPQMDRIADDVRGLADVADVYSAASTDLFDGLDRAAVTAHTLTAHHRDLDQALIAAIGFADTGADIVDRGGPYLLRGLRDGISTSALLDTYSPALFCAIRNYHDLAPKIDASVGGNGYSIRTHSQLLGAANPYVYPDNLPRVNASGGPGGGPGCWQPVTRELWPAPYLVMDTGASIAPYNHLELGQPLALDYVWGRQLGENTINP